MKARVLKEKMTAMTVSLPQELKDAIHHAAHLDYSSSPSAWVCAQLVPKLRRRGLLKPRK